MVTLDAMGCQISIARQSRGQEADYVLHTRANHQGLRDCLKDTFALEQTRDCAGCRHDYADSVGKDHKGQIETHCCGDRVTTDTRCFISSLSPKAKPLLQAVCRHWSIENAPHWVLDVAFGEDDSRIRTGHAVHTLAISSAWPTSGWRPPGTRTTCAG